MPLFLWKKSYEIGVNEIDMQHRRLVAMINELSDAMMLQKGYRAVPDTLEKLGDYIQFHFSTEEEIMRNTTYPDFEEHCQEHLEMTNKVLEFKEMSSQHHGSNAAEILDFLCDWLKEHIAVRDKGLKAYIKDEKSAN